MSSRDLSMFNVIPYILLPQMPAYPRIGKSAKLDSLINWSLQLKISKHKNLKTQKTPPSLSLQRRVHNLQTG